MMRCTVHILALFLLALPYGSLAQEATHHENTPDFDHHCYFQERSISLGIGLPYSTHFNTVGINGRFYYNIGEKICFGPEIAFFKKGDKQILDIDVVGHYIFETHWFGIYPLIGANYTQEEEEESTKMEEALGLVIGTGIHRNLGKITVFIEYAHVASTLSDSFITTGFLFSFK